MDAGLPSPNAIAQWVNDAVVSTPAFDLHTHLYPAHFGPLMLWGIDELLTYHYLVGEAIRASGIAYDVFWVMSRSAQADFIWQALFVERAPLSEACRGVLTVLRRLGLDMRCPRLDEHRAFFRNRSPAEHVDGVLRAANVSTVMMTNDPFDPVERAVWLAGPARDPRFRAVLRIDPLLLGWPGTAQLLAAQGYEAAADLGGTSMAVIRQFLVDWIDRMGAVYVAASLPPTWRYPAPGDPGLHVLEEAVLPVCRERNLPFAMMIGVSRQANPLLRLAGDSLGRADVSSLERLCAAHPANRFVATMLSREDQHALAVAGRLFPNLLVFGCWWYLNNPVLVNEITRMRVELLGPSFVPQHSDARVLDQLIYKWDHSRQIIGRVLVDKFADLAATGWPVSRDMVRQAVGDYLSGNAQRFLDGRAPGSSATGEPAAEPSRHGAIV